AQHVAGDQPRQRRPPPRGGHGPGRLARRLARMNELLDRLGRRFARVTTNAVVVRPALWPLFRGPLRKQFDHLASTWEGRLGPEALAPLVAALERVGAAKRVLDLGTGTGKAARLAAGRFPDADV